MSEPEERKNVPERKGGPEGNTAMDALEAMGTARSIHRYREEPVPEGDLARILFAASRGPSGSNRQPFRFVVLRDGERGREAKALLGRAFREAWAGKASAEGWEKGMRPESRGARTARAMQEFVDGFERIPVVVLVCMAGGRGRHLWDGASVYPACQNLLVAARALGYGSCITLWHGGAEAELRPLLGIPDDVVIAATMPIGRPRGRHGPLRRRPLRDLVYDEGWDEPADWATDPPGTRFSRGGPPRPKG